MIKGTIKLLNSHEIVWKCCKYEGRMQRDKIIARWEKLHPDICHGGFIQINPSVDPNKVDEVTGLNKKRNLSVAFQKNIKRPPAIYNNTNAVDKYL